MNEREWLLFNVSWLYSALLSSGQWLQINVTHLNISARRLCTPMSYSGAFYNFIIIIQFQTLAAILLWPACLRKRFQQLLDTHKHTDNQFMSGQWLLALLENNKK